MKIITFSLWGNEKRYFFGALRNCEIALDLFPDWKCQFYIRSDSNRDYINEIKSFSNSIVIEMEADGEKRGLFWRFLPVFNKNIDVTIVRDLDSRLSHRELYAIDEWINSDMPFHIMRDHPYHNTEILGGMWGVKNKEIDLGTPLTLEEISTYRDEYQEDQRYLREKIWPLVKDKSMIHDEFFGGNKFPKERIDFEFVGQQFNEEDIPVKENANILKRYLEKK